MIIHNFDPIAVDLIFFQVRWYSISYILAILLGWAYSKIIIKQILKKYNILLIDYKLFDDCIIYLILGIIIGGRLGYVFFYNFTYFLYNPLEIFQVWKGGMSFHGGFLGIIFAIFLFYKNKKISFFKISDIISCVSPIGLFLGRIANFINGELYGKISTLPWSIIFPGAGNLSRHPSQIYEAVLEGLFLFLIINFLALKKELILRPGITSSLFLILYSFFRMIGEIFREPDQHLGYIFNNISMGFLLSLFMLFSGFVMLFYLYKNEKIK